MSVEPGLRPLVVLLIAWALGLLASGWAPHDRITWLLEVAPAIIAALILLATYRQFRLSTLTYYLILVHGLILMLGGAYTYARVPAGAWVQEWFGLTRNPYDKLGHLAQGFVPAIVARELLLRRFRMSDGRLTDFLVICICLAISAFYELLEWWTALAAGDASQDFLGTQGDPFDTQSDMWYALLGAAAAVVLLRRAHDRSMAAVSRPPQPVRR